MSCLYLCLYVYMYACILSNVTDTCYIATTQLFKENRCQGGDTVCAKWFGEVIIEICIHNFLQ